MNDLNEVRLELGRKFELCKDTPGFVALHADADPNQPNFRIVVEEEEEANARDYLHQIGFDGNISIFEIFENKNLEDSFRIETGSSIGFASKPIVEAQAQEIPQIPLGVIVGGDRCQNTEYGVATGTIALVVRNAKLKGAKNSNFVEWGLLGVNHVLAGLDEDGLNKDPEEDSLSEVEETESDNYSIDIFLNSGREEDQAKLSHYHKMLDVDSSRDVALAELASVDLRKDAKENFILTIGDVNPVVGPGFEFNIGKDQPVKMFGAESHDQVGTYEGLSYVKIKYNEEDESIFKEVLRIPDNFCREGDSGAAVVLSNGNGLFGMIFAVERPSRVRGPRAKKRNSYAIPWSSIGLEFENT